VKITVEVPHIPAGLISNLVGLAGLVAVAAAVGGLTHNLWWSVLAGGVMAVGLAALAQSQPEAAEMPDLDQTREIPRLRRQA
jgi:hypothetical protein